MNYIFIILFIVFDGNDKLSEFELEYGDNDGLLRISLVLMELIQIQ